MTLLSIWEFGIGGLALITLALLGLSGAAFWFANKVSKSGGVRTGATSQILDNEKTPIYKVTFFWGGVLLVIAWVVVMFMIASDYKPAKPHTVTPLEDGRTPAGE